MIAAKRQSSKMPVLDAATLEKSGYMVNLLNKYPQFREMVSTDYNRNAAKSGWTLTKVFVLFMMCY